MRPGDEFIKIFNELEATLRKRINQENYKPFYQLVDLAAGEDSVVRRNRDILKSFGDLRNAIVHDREYPSKILADPRHETLNKLKQILKVITKPQTLISRFKKEIKLFTVDESLVDCLSYMEQNDFSQIVVFDSSYRLLSSEGIIGWLRSARDIGLADLQNATIGDALGFEDMKGCHYLSRNDPIDLAIEVFETSIQKGVPRLHAILVTESGKDSERPLGFITPWDLLNLGDLE